MFTKTLTVCAILPTLIFGTTLAMAAPGGDDTRGEATSERGDDHSETTEQGPSPLELDIDLISAKATGDAGQGVYELLLDGEVVTLELDRDGREEAVSVYDDRGDLVVGYVVSGRRVAIFDANGLVESGIAGRLDPSMLADYGAPGALIVSPWWIMKALLALQQLINSDISMDAIDIDDFDGPAALWFLCLRAELSVSVNSNGEWEASLSIGWDC